MELRPYGCASIRAMDFSPTLDLYIQRLEGENNG